MAYPAGPCPCSIEASASYPAASKRLLQCTAVQIVFIETLRMTSGLSAGDCLRAQIRSPEHKEVKSAGTRDPSFGQLPHTVHSTTVRGSPLAASPGGAQQQLQGIPVYVAEVCPFVHLVFERLGMGIAQNDHMHASSAAKACV